MSRAGLDLHCVGALSAARRAPALSAAETVSNRDVLTGHWTDPPLDLVHLARHCLGDRALEEELLRLFRLQSNAAAAELSEAPALSLESKANIVHKLRGSALAVGASRVARAATRIEELASAAAREPLQGAEEIRSRSGCDGRAALSRGRGGRRDRSHPELAENGRGSPEILRGTTRSCPRGHRSGGDKEPHNTTLPALARLLYEGARRGRANSHVVTRESRSSGKNSAR